MKIPGMKLIQVCSILGIGIIDVVRKLNELGVQVGAEPNTRLSNDQFLEIAKQFCTEEQYKKLSNELEAKHTKFAEHAEPIALQDKQQLLEEEVKQMLKHSYRWENIIFDNQECAKKFLKKIKNIATEERWSWEESDDQMEILQSYLTYTFAKLVKEGNKIKEGKNKNGEMCIAFNTNLLSIHFEDIYVVGEKILYKNELYLKNPRVEDEVKLSEIYGINAEELLPPKYFTKIDDIIFDTKKKIAYTQTEKINHVLEQMGVRAKSTSIEDLKKAVGNAVKMAQRNYKYVVPMYNPKKDAIQFLMPLYLKDSKKTPDGALILTPSKKYYIPETVLTLKEAYIDIRLIAKPDNTWNI